jgi:hypothetical protein
VGITEVPIAELAQEPIDRTRAHLDPDRVAFYAAHPDTAPPVTVFDVDGTLLLADGYHRVAAAQRLGRTTVRAEVRRGQRADALRFAVDRAREQRGLSEEEILAAIWSRSSPGGPPAE